VLDAPAVEITYGLERILMSLQGVKHFKDIRWGAGSSQTRVTPLLQPQRCCSGSFTTHRVTRWSLPRCGSSCCLLDPLCCGLMQASTDLDYLPAAAAPAAAATTTAVSVQVL